LRHLLASGKVETRVVAPVPWFPFRSAVFGEYAQHAAVPRHELHNGISVHHPRYLLLPKVGMSSAPYTLARAGLAAARRLISDGYDFDLIDAHYFYPDGVAASIIGKELQKPVVITARGTDINQIPQYKRPRRMILKAAQECARIVTVCTALKQGLVDIGAPAEKIEVLRNGVDLQLFYPVDKQGARSSLGMDDSLSLASVGHLVERKGHHLVIEAIAQIPSVRLYVAGSGREESRLRRLAGELGVTSRVEFLGSLTQVQLRSLYSAVDSVVLASSREGWANVLLEAMACGTPVVASRVWGTPEVVASADAGVLIDELSAAGVVRALEQLRKNLPSRHATRAYAEQFGWDATTSGQLSLFGEVLDRIVT